MKISLTDFQISIILDRLNGGGSAAEQIRQDIMLQIEEEE